MALVDPEDDSIIRYVLMHYRYDPDRHERRHVAVAAYDNEPEFERAFATLAAEIERARAAGGDVDRQEHVTGHIREPGHRARAQYGRLISRAIEHGVAPSDVRRADLPVGMALVQSRRDD